MITINLYDYRRVLQQVAIQKQISAILVAMTLVLVFCGLNWIVEKTKVGNLNNEVQKIEGQIKILKPDFEAVQALRGEKKAVSKIITGIDDLRAKRNRTTEILEDIGRNLPEDVWLRGIQQLDMKGIKGKRIPFLFIDYEAKQNPAEEFDDIFFEIVGAAKYDQSVVQFVELLENVSYFDHVVLLSTKQEWIGLEPIREFSIYCHVVLSEKPEEKE